MAFEKAKEYLEGYGLAGMILENRKFFVTVCG